MGFKKGYVPWNKGKKLNHSVWNAGKTKTDDPRIAKLATSDGQRLKEFWFKKGEKTWNFGTKIDKTLHPKMGHNHPHTSETKKKISENRRGKALGEANGNWNNGGCQTERHQEMGRWQYKEWRMEVFTRDNYTCQGCGQRGGKLQADHKVPWSVDSNLRYVISNGRTLCETCHKKTPTWGGGSVSILSSKLFSTEGGD